jgi:hypothetical protein
MEVSGQLHDPAALAPEKEPPYPLERRRKQGGERDEVTDYWRKLHSEELPNSYSSQTVNWVTRSRNMKWTGRVTFMKG